MGPGPLSQSSSPQLTRVGVISALPAEAKCLAKRPAPLNSPIHINDHLVVMISGMGADRAQKAAEELLRMNIKVLLSWGIAGGLDENLRSGDLILPDKISSLDGQIYTTDANLNRQINACLTDSLISVNCGLLTEAKEVLGSVQQKSDVHQSTGARAIDMESAAIAKVASKANLSFVAIRAIVDESNMIIPACVLKTTDIYGRPDFFHLLIELLLSPGQIRPLYQLSRAMKQAMNTLKIISDNFLQSNINLAL